MSAAAHLRLVALQQRAVLQSVARSQPAAAAGATTATAATNNPVAVVNNGRTYAAVINAISGNAATRHAADGAASASAAATARSRSQKAHAGAKRPLSFADKIRARHAARAGAPGTGAGGAPMSASATAAAGGGAGGARHAVSGGDAGATRCTMASLFVATDSDPRARARAAAELAEKEAVQEQLKMAVFSRAASAKVRLHRPAKDRPRGEEEREIRQGAKKIVLPRGEEQR